MSIHTVAFVVFIILAFSVSASAKTGSVLCQPDRMANARRNIERYQWARDIRDKAVAEAKVYADQPDDFLWELVTPQDIPRGIHANMKEGCPKCGKDIEKFGNYPWKCDVINKPWKIECPSCGEFFPKNDFAKYYESGKDKQGIFHLDKADRSLLFNTEHPDPKDPLHTYGVDDGLGWKDSKGNVYRFIGYYGHYGSWAAALSALRRLEDAYIYTGDPVYARKAGVILYRAADFYPGMDWSKWAKLGFTNSDGNSGKGKIYGRIWETGVANTLISAYDAVFSALDDPQLLSYLSQKTGKQIDKATFHRVFEKDVIYETHDAILRLDIAGNEGMHQSTMAMAAVVLDQPGVSEKWIDWIFADGNLLHGDINGGNIKRLFETKIDSDGMGNEAAPSYNGLWRKTFNNISEYLEVYPRYKGPQITDFPKYRKMYEAPMKLICLDKFIPIIGDCGKTGAPDTGGITVAELVYAYQTFHDTIFAQMAYFLNGNKIEGIHGSIFDADPEVVARKIEAVIKEKGPYTPKTEDMRAYGLSILRRGTGENARALSLYYGRNTGHGHKDTLNIELFAKGIDLMPDMGYPEYATVWPSRQEWTSNTISHNTVVVDQTKQRDSHSGTARFVEDGDGASAVEVYADKVYPQTSLYQRTAALVDVSDSDFYLVDIFRVEGGKEHHYSLHGPEGEVEAEGLNLIEQKNGTLAGEDIKLGADLGGREDLWKDASGFQYLYDVKRDSKPAENASVTWKLKDTWNVLKTNADIRLRMNLINPQGEVVLAHGDPPQNKPGNPRRLTYLITANKSSKSTFVSVIEPYSGSQAIKDIKRTDDADTVTLKMTLTSGRIDYIISSTHSKSVKLNGKYPFTGRFGVISEENGKFIEKLLVR